MKPNKIAKKLLIEELKARKYKAAGFILLSILTGFLEAAGIGLIFPFIYILVSPSAVNNFRVVRVMKHVLGITTTYSFTIFLLIMIAVLICMKTMYSVLFQYLQMKTLVNLKTNLSARLMKMYLYVDFTHHVEKGSSWVVKHIAVVGIVFDHYIFSIVKMTAAAAIISSLMFVLCMVLPIGALGAAVIFSTLLTCLYHFSKKRLRNIGVEANEIYTSRQQVLYSSLGAIRETKAFGKEGFFAEQFKKVERRNFGNHQLYNFFCGVPPVIIEAGALIGVMMLIMFYLYRNEHAHALAILSVLVAVMFRMLPQVNAILMGLQLLNSSVPYVDNIAGELATYEEESKEVCKLSTSEKLEFNQFIQFKNAWYKYPNQKDEWALSNINLKISPGHFVGITGHSAAGKSTFINLLLCLLDPSKGEIIVDDTVLNAKGLSRKWLNNIGYVPQGIFIFEDSIICNIAYGVLEKDIDIDRIHEVMRLVGLNDLLEKGEDFLKMKVGEHGATLSGGQRQRIGLARALYRDPSILVLDESTANLDLKLERFVLDNLLNITPKKTIILITHRLDALKKCDQILLFAHGEIVGEGTYDKLSHECAEFMRLLGKKVEPVAA